MSRYFKAGFKETLSKVITAQNCTGCAACITTCPSNCLSWTEEKVELTGLCNSCGACSKVCPRYDLSQKKLEKLVFGKNAKTSEEYGIHRQVLVAKSTNARILKACQDGGVVTTLLAFGLNSKIFDGAAISGTDKSKPLYPTSLLATTCEQVIKSAGTRYSHSPNLLAIQEGIKQKRKSLAFVGTPCQVQAVRSLQNLSKNYAGKTKLTIGLMCSETFSYKGLIEDYLRGQLGIDPRQIRKTNIKGKLILTMKSGETIRIQLRNVKQYVRPECNSCRDFSARLADLSVGGLGLNGWSLVVTRTKTGDRIFENAVKEGLLVKRPISEEKDSLNLLIKLSKTKALSKN